MRPRPKKAGQAGWLARKKTMLESMAKAPIFEYAYPAQRICLLTRAARVEIVPVFPGLAISILALCISHDLCRKRRENSEIGGPNWTRTSDQGIMSPLLYPTEL